jgi:hypothetical protein
MAGEKVKILPLEELVEISGADGETYGPFKVGEPVEIPVENAEVLISSGRAKIFERKNYVYKKIKEIIEKERPREEELENFCEDLPLLTKAEIKNRKRELIETGEIFLETGKWKTKKDRNQEALKILKNPKLLSIIIKEISLFVTGEEGTKTTFFLLCLSKDFNPQSILVVSQSSSGKSYMVNHILDFFPEEVVDRFTRSTPRALEYRYENESLEGKVLLIQEAAGGEQAHASLRPLVSRDQNGLEIITVGTDRRPHRVW